MARSSRGPSRLDKRREMEAVEAQGGDVSSTKPSKSRKSAEKAEGDVKPKKAPAKSKKAKDRPAHKKRLVWVVFSPSMKEEGRFAYDQRPAAEERLEALKLKHKKPYFIQPVKEVLSETGAVISSGKPATEVKERPARRRVEKRDDEEEDNDRDDTMGGADDDDE